MEDNQFKGALASGLGQAETAVGAVVGDAELEGQGTVRQVLGDAQAGVGKVQAVIGDEVDDIADSAAYLGEQASAGIATAGGKVTDAYRKAVVRAKTAADKFEPFVQKQPYAALGVAAVAGLLIGLLMTRGGPKMVYVRPPRAS